ncbi:MAG TPA: baseplate J/gp47 family protein [Mycobacterium sp.]|jgi:hypothetical protein
MSGTTSVPSPTWTAEGLLLPTEAQILAGVQADINAALGGGVNPALETPQGQLASSETAILADTNDQFLFLVQQFDPAYSSGRYQDALGRIYFLSRNPALPTTVTALCTGLVGAIIPAGSLARAIDGNMYQSLAAGTFGVGGTVSIEFQCTVNGPITCPAGALSQIYQSVSGWDSITNPADGVVGNNVETRTAFEHRRQQTIAANSVSLVASVQGAVLEVDNVLDAYTTENFTGNPVVLDGVTLPAHSLYVCAAGGAPQDIGEAIWSKKSLGCAMAGNTTVTVTDSNSGYTPPAPTYQITYQTAVPQTFVMQVNLVKSPLVPANAGTLIANAVLAAWAGLDGGPRMRIGATVYASRFYAPVALLGPWAQIIEIQVGSSAHPTASFTASIATNQLTVSAIASGVIAVGTVVQGVSVPDGTVVTALGTGTGGTGTYTLSVTALTVASEAMYGVTPSGDFETVGIAHVPVISAANVLLVLT